MQGEGEIGKYERHTKKFVNDMHIYQMITVAGAWLSINFIMKINR